MRRKFYNIPVAHKSAVATEAPERIAALYAIEKEIHGRSPEERRAIRNEHSRPRADGRLEIDNEDRSIVATISTSGSKTSGMKSAVGKILKLRSDMLFLAMVQAARRVIVLSETDMFNQCEKESTGGRVPPEIEFVCAEIPDEVRTRLIAARLKASRESVGTPGAEQ